MKHVLQTRNGIFRRYSISLSNLHKNYERMRRGAPHGRFGRHVRVWKLKEEELKKRIEKEEKKRVKEEEKKKEEKKEFEVPKWVKATVAYEGIVKSSYHIDAGCVRFSLEKGVRETVVGCMERVKEIVVKHFREGFVDKDGHRVKWNDCSWDELVESFGEDGLRIGVGLEDDGEAEEWCEVWRK